MRRLSLFSALLVCVNFCYNICAVSAQGDAEKQRENWSSERIENPSILAGVIDLSYEECSNNGTCKVITKFVEETPFSSPWQVVVNQEEELRNLPSRTKRRIFGVDNRLRIHSPYNRQYPFSSTVAVRVRDDDDMPTCSGIALAHNLFLTAAHCFLSSTGKLQVSNLSVGILQRNDTLKWTRVIETKYNNIWKYNGKRRKGRKNYRKFRHDYAVLRTVSPLDVAPMTIAAVGENNKGKEILKSGKTFIHFSAFDDKIPYILRYRFCKVERLTRRKIYSRCDTVPKTAGAGVYVLMRNKDTRKVERKVIAIETGDYRIASKNDATFSSSLRISRLQFIQICFWVTGNYGMC